MKTRAILLLSEYEAANLREALIAINGNRDYDDGVKPSPLGALNTGDWVSQIRFALDAIGPFDCVVNRTAAEACDAALAWKP